MRIFVYEHLTDGGLPQAAISESMRREGLAMLEGIASDLRRLPGVEVARLGEHRGSFDRLALESDGVLVIAPELDGVLSRLSRRVLDAGGRLLGSAPEPIDAACDKLELARRLAERRVPCLPTEAYEPGRIPGCGFPAVIKPRRGAGSTGVRLVRAPEDLLGAAGESGAELIATQLREGIAASVLLIAGPRGILPLRAGEQVLSDDGAFRYLGGRIPLSPRLEARAKRLALRAASSIPGLLGFAGVDLVLDPTGEDSPGDCVVEVNARLTTSYVGLRALAATNLAEHWLRGIHGEFPAAPEWRAGGVRFTPDGAVELLGGRA